MTEDAKLEACPFCGGPGDIESQPSYDQAANTYERHRGWCDYCGYGLDWHSYLPDAIASWNTRSPDTRLAQAEAALKFYASDGYPGAWTQPVTPDRRYQGPAHCGHRADGPPIPSEALLADQGKIARAALSTLVQRQPSPAEVRAEAIEEVRDVLQSIVDATSVGKRGSAATRSKYGNYPAALYHRAIRALKDQEASRG